MGVKHLWNGREDTWCKVEDTATVAQIYWAEDDDAGDSDVAVSEFAAKKYVGKGNKIAMY